MNLLEKMVWAAAMSQMLLTKDEIEEAVEEADAQVKELREWVKVSGRLHTDDDLEAERKAEEDGAQ